MIYEYENGIPADVLVDALKKSLEGRQLKKVLTDDVIVVLEKHGLEMD